MAGSAKAVSDSTVQALLKQFREEPKNSDGVQELELDAIYAYLERSTVAKSRFHWFCRHAEPLVLESASFLLRLFAYNSPKVELWKAWLNNCLGSCSECVLGFEKAKIGSRDTYFGAFPDDVKDAFWQSFNSWELEHVLAQLSDSSHISPATVYRMVCNFQTFQDSRVQSFLIENLPAQSFSDWPSNPVIPSILVLMIHEDPNVRDWALKQASRCTIIPTPDVDAASLPYSNALEVILLPFTSGADAPTDASFLRLVTEPATLWSSFQSILRLLHPKHLTHFSSRKLDARHVVTGHLHDHGPEFKTVLQCFHLILKRLGKELWVGESPEYPQVVFDAFKDNPSLNTLVCEKDLSAERNPWFFNWLPEFLLTICDQPAYSEVVAKMADFMCEELQHERFGNARPIIMACAARLLKGQNRDDNNAAIANVLDIHAEALIKVSFASSHRKAEWTVARGFTRDLIHLALVQDTKNIQNALDHCCIALSLAVAKRHIPDSDMTPLIIREQLWKRIYNHLEPTDTEGLACVLSILASAAHFDSIRKEAFGQVLSFPGLSSLIDAVNRSLGIVKNGFPEFTSGYGVALAAPNIVRQPGVARDLIKLMLSPMADLHSGAMGIVSQADEDSADGRRDCFKWLFEKFPKDSFLGSAELLKVFNNYARKLPEACSLSKSLVRCFTDIIGVLCSTRHGLLHNPEYLQPSDSDGPASRIPELWTLMCNAIMVIFKRTPSWSKYYKNEEMTEWMRDALIFARDILGQKAVFESAANATSSTSSSKSKVAKRMSDDLHEILVELTRWLRLTDEELLHQSCILLHSLLEFFRETDNPPQRAVLEKLSKQVAEVRNRDFSSMTSRLDLAKLVPLENMLASFDDNEIEIVEVKPAAQSKVSTKPKAELKAGLREVSAKIKAPHFSSTDQERLDVTTSMPKFRKPSAPSQVSAQISLPSAKSAVGGKSRGDGDSDSESNSEESGEEESQRTTLASLSALQKSPKVRKPVERRQVKLLDLPHLKQNATEARLAKRDEVRQKALRFKPDISSLHKTLLSWDYQHEGSTPPKTPLQLRSVPDTFADFNHYRAVFEPLLLMECWAQLLQSKDESPESFQCRVTSKQYNGQWTDIQVIFDEALGKEWLLTENDVVLLRHPEGKSILLAKAMSFRRPGREPGEAGLRCCVSPDARDPGLSIQSSWQISKVFRLVLSTLHREYAALVAAEYYDFADWILRPHLSLPSKVDSRDLQQAVERYKVNQPQAKAIVSALKTDGFVLIQGPPGTGKTSTICALISASLKVHPQALKNAEKRKILLCAPSNAAIDEIVYRLKDKYHALKVVRTGATRAISLNVKDVSLDSLIEEKLGTDGQKESNETTSEMVSARQEFQSAKKLRQDKIQELQKLRETGARLDSIEAEVKQLTIKTTSWRQRLDSLRDKHTSQSRTMDTARRRARDEVLREADVICSTLSGTGHENLEQYEFEMVIIDEAAQAIELSSLIPLKYKCNRCVMVGDPQQLPPTVISMEASKYQYNQSLFVRLQKQRPEAVHLLSIQYRMHPEISKLPSNIFYSSRLQDGPDMDKKTVQPWHTHSKFGAYRFFDVKTGLEESSGRSTKNKTEAQVAVALFNRLRKDFPSVNFSSRIGIVSMYSAQIRELKAAFELRFGRNILNEIDFRTVDGFQGQEKDVIILSCVRAGPGVTNIGHVKDIRRMNVAITRAKSSLFILGNAATLERSNETWRAIVADSKSRDYFAQADVSYFTEPSAPPRPSDISPASARPKSQQMKIPVPAPIPLDLSTPAEFKAATSNSTPKTALPPAEPMLLDGPIALDKQKGKRKQEEVASDPKPSTADKPRPSTSNPPPRKRPKQAPALFIPKNKNKRP